MYIGDPKMHPSESCIREYLDEVEIEDFLREARQIVGGYIQVSEELKELKKQLNNKKQ